ncbi:ATP-binding protein [Plantactinospora sp. BB1]|uniref:ATP-binding protein n=1 Tax=Plantactinospora sp. BB1 TaxID=2071627 RepID=UPI001F32572E|nr:ATP-binding protein [Plantactinospora sp. BB1]
MAPVIRCDVEVAGSYLLARLTGDLALVTTATVRAGLLQCLAEQPDGLLVDLSEMLVREATALSVFGTVARQAALWPGTPVLLCAPDPGTARLLAGGAFGRLAVFGSTREAVAAEPGRRLPSAGELLLPLAGSASRARDVVTEALTRWELPNLVAPVSIVATELVANAVLHARTMMDLRISRCPSQVMLSVCDGSTVEPRLCRRRPSRRLVAG